MIDQEQRRSSVSLPPDMYWTSSPNATARRSDFSIEPIINGPHGESQTLFAVLTLIQKKTQNGSNPLKGV